MADPDGREPRVCPACQTLCVYDGWDHVHPDGFGIGSCWKGQAKFLSERALSLKAAVQRVRDLHRQKSSFGDPYCSYDNEDWPCSTITALDGS